MIHLDLETRSKTDLTTDGAYNYATCPTTQVVCMAWAFGNGEINLWRPLTGEAFPQALQGYIDDGVPLYAHNAQFERLMFDYVIANDARVRAPALDQWRCTAFQARCNNLPASLHNAARCLGVAHQKDARGRELIRMLSVPLPDGTFNEDPVLLDEFYEYCRQDIRVERELYKVMREPTTEEWEDYWVCEQINDRGIRIDRGLAQAAVNYAAEEEADMIARITEVTGGAVTKARGEGLKGWVVERLNPAQEQLLVRYRGGEKKLSLDKHNRSRLLDDADLDPDVREVVECSDAAQKSSVGKYRALLSRADPESDRVSGAFLANGASQSGRYSSWGAQVHNFPRKVMESPQELRADLIDDVYPEDIVDYFGSPIMTLLSRMLRPTLIPGDYRLFLVSDWSAIEGRVNPWLTDSTAGERKLDMYRSGVDTYKVAAQAIYNVPYDEVTADQRQVGKVAELALGFGGGAGAFLSMARNYGVDIERGEAERIKERWRRNNTWATQFWAACEKAAMRALRNPGQRFDVGRVSYFAVERVLVGAQTLFCELPCGRLLTYPDARIGQRMAPWGEPVQAISALRAAWTPKATEREWPRMDLWGGLLVENVVQGTAASLLRYALREATALGLDIVLHVHDEIVCESRLDRLNDHRLILQDIMNRPPAWAASLPLAAEPAVMERFGK